MFDLESIEGSKGRKFRYLVDMYASESSYRRRLQYQ